MKNIKGFDEKCLDLAKYFYPDMPSKRQEALAGDIQDAVETFGEWHERNAVSET